MAKILNKVKVYLYQSRLHSAETRLNFLKNILPIKQSELSTVLDKKLVNLKFKKNDLIVRHAIVAGVEHDLLTKEFEAEIEAIDSKYYWKEREVAETIRREKLEDKKLLEDLSKEKQVEINALKQKYHPDCIDDSKRIAAKEEMVNVEKEYTLRAKKLTEKYRLKLENFTKKTEASINRLQAIVENNQKHLSETLKENQKIELDDGVLLKLDNLSMHFGGLKAVDELSFSVKEGEIFGLIGPNGAGKTTVFNCITRFYKPTSGGMTFKNKSGKNVDLNDIVVHNIIKQGIARTFQNVEMIWELNILENLLVAAHTEYRSGFFGHLLNSRLLRQEERIMRAKAMKILEDLELTQYAYYYPMGLPYGILKKVELARTLMVNPKLIILDEPAAGLNDTETVQLANTIRKIRDEYKTTIFLVEHDMGLVMDICDTVCAISFGKKLEMGTPKVIQSSKVVQEAYLGGE